MSVFIGLSRLDKTYQYLLIFYGLIFPLSAQFGDIIQSLIVIIWLFSGNYRQKWQQTISNKLAVASIIFFMVNLIGLLWTYNIDWGIHIIGKIWYYLLILPIFINIAKKPFIKYYISAFILAMTLSELLSYMIWFELIPTFGHATVYEPIVFMGHISYNPLLAFAIYLVAHRLLIINNTSKIMKVVYIFILISMIVNMFITGGRAGQIVFFVMTVVLIFQYFNYNIIKSLLTSIIVVSGIFTSAYLTSSIFYERVNKAIYSISNYNNDKNTNVGSRLAYSQNSWHIIKNNPIIGVGTGDFPSEYAKINNINTPNLHTTYNPHNMYTIIITQLGIIGLVSMLSLFYYQFKHCISIKNKSLGMVGIAFSILFLVIMFSDSYLIWHYTKKMFVFFSAFLYKNYADN